MKNLCFDPAQATSLCQGDFSEPVDFYRAVLDADWACYPEPDDQVDGKRLDYTLSLFADGFRLWQCPDQDGVPRIVGYTGWYPIAPGIFSVLENTPEQLSHRGEIMPCKNLSPHYLYLFNYSLIDTLHHTSTSRQMLTMLADDIRRVNPVGLAAITVSPAGQRVARRFGMHPVGPLGQDSDTVFTGRLRDDTA